MSKKQEIISFKVEEDLAELIRQLPNRSEFIRNAILTAVDNTCPLCQGSGRISQSQKSHLSDFMQHHHLVTCDSCDARYFSCDDGESAEHNHQ